LIKGDPAEPLLEVEVLDVHLTYVVPLVLEILIDRFFHLVLQHLFGIVALLIICLAVIIYLSSDYVVSDQIRLVFARVKERQV
jgi:hypothetical protein